MAARNRGGGGDGHIGGRQEGDELGKISAIGGDGVRAGVAGSGF